MKREIDVITPPSLLVRLKDHSDETAWKLFVEVYGPLIYGFCRNRGLQPNDASDVAQESLLRVAKAIGRFEYDPAKGLFRDWLAKIVINELRMASVKRFAEPKPSAELENSGQQFESCWREQYSHHLYSVALKMTEEHFSPETWQLFQMNWVEKKSADEVARRFGVGIEKVYVARSRVLKQLKFQLGQLTDDML